MKATGIVRNMDSLGRIVIPVELRRTMKLDTKDAIEIYVDEDMIILKKYHPACIFCNSAADIIEYQGKTLCKQCISTLFKQVQI